MRLSTGLRSTILSSASISQVEEKPSPSIRPIHKSGKKTPCIGNFWFGCTGDYKRGLEILGKNLVDWYSGYLINKKDKIQSISRTVVADAFFSKEAFITPMCERFLSHQPLSE